MKAYLINFRHGTWIVAHYSREDAIAYLHEQKQVQVSSECATKIPDITVNASITEPCFILDL